MKSGGDNRQKYSDIAHILFDIMINITELEYQYSETNDTQLLTIIEYHGWLLEYWENQMYAIYGHYSFDLSLFLR